MRRWDCSAPSHHQCKSFYDRERALAKVRKRQRHQLEELNHVCGRFEIRAFVLDPLTIMAPLIVGEDVALLGNEDSEHHAAESCLILRSKRSVRSCTEYYDKLWSDERAVVIADATGPTPTGFAEVKDRLDRLSPSG